MSDRIEKQTKEYVERVLKEMDPNPDAPVTFVAKPMPELLAAAVRFGVTLGRAEALTSRTEVEA